MLNKKAPDFTLSSSTGNKVTLQDLAGSFVVLVFYPANDSPTCNTQLAEVNVNLEDFLQNNARIFGVNTASEEKHRDYCQRRRLNFPILSDKKCVVAKQFGANFKWLPMVIRRTVVVIDPDGVVCFFEHGKPEPGDVLKSIQARAKDRVSQ